MGFLRGGSINLFLNYQGLLFVISLTMEGLGFCYLHKYLLERFLKDLFDLWESDSLVKANYRFSKEDWVEAFVSSCRDLARIWPQLIGWECVCWSHWQRFHSRKTICESCLYFLFCSYLGRSLFAKRLFNLLAACFSFF